VIDRLNDHLQDVEHMIHLQDVEHMIEKRGPGRACGRVLPVRSYVLPSRMGWKFKVSSSIANRRCHRCPR
jgi:hypothetical protein